MCNNRREVGLKIALLINPAAPMDAQIGISMNDNNGSAYEDFVSL